MGHRTYLLIRTERLEAELFEANNYLPFFWLTLLDQQHLAEIEPVWLHDDQLLLGDETERERYDNIWPRPTNIQLAKAALEQNAARAQPYIAQYFSEQVALYQDFVRYLLSHLPVADDYLHVDIFALTAFAGTEDFLQSLRDQLAAIDQRQAPPGGPSPEPTLLTGFIQPPVAIGSEYPALQRLWAAQQPAPVEQAPAASRPSRWFYTLLGFASGLLCAGYQGYRTHGLVWWVGGLGLVGILILIIVARKGLRKPA